ncbi:uroporphyrinogen-III synthase [Pseudohoeflea suaedae]|nr:uroporphyrinogen-III synthase [Pseudohoeflea suaedae]
MRVLVTRPEPAAYRTAERLVALGHEPVLLPLYETRLLEPEPGFTGRPWPALVFTSANAVKAVGNRFAAAGRPVYTVGAATAQAARGAGYETVRAGSGSGRDLAELIAGEAASGVLAAPEGAPVLYLTTDDRRRDLEEGLAKAGIPVEALCVYRMEEISYTTDFVLSVKITPLPDAVLLYSPKAARRFFELVAAQTLDSPAGGTIVSCLSADVAAACPRSLGDGIRIAEAPNEAALLETLGSLR